MKRVIFDFEDEGLTEMDEMARRAGLQTRTELLNEALSFFEYMLRHTEKTGNLPLVKEVDGSTKDVAGAPFVRAREEFRKSLT